MGLTFALLAMLQSKLPGPLPIVQEQIIRELRLKSTDKAGEMTLIQASDAKLDPPKKSPLNGWDFEHVTAGFAREKEDEAFNLRVRVFSQYRPDSGDPTDDAARLLMRLWEFNRWRLGVDHQNLFHLRSVDVYLCAGGGTGGEQVMMEDPFQSDQAGRPARVNNIYIYGVASLSDRMEFAREVAHEYGHATWPPFGGYSKPEQWISGDMGERVFLTWMLKAVREKKASMADVMRAPFDDLDDYYDFVVKPDLRRVAILGPNIDVLNGSDKAAYKEALGLVSYVAASVPSKVFGRALLLTKDRRIANFPSALLEAAREAKTIEFSVPEGLEGHALWLPLYDAEIKGAKVLRRQGGWVKVQPTAKTMVGTYPVPGTL